MTTLDPKMTLGLAGAMSLCGAIALTMPTEAQACSVAEGIWNTTPNDGETLAADSRVLLSGAFAVDDIHVEVDGEPSSTTLVRDANFPGKGFSGAYLLEPFPAVGSTVSIRHCYSEDGCDQMESWTWTIGEADTTAPAPAEDPEFGIYDHQDVDTSGDSCADGTLFDLSLYVHASLPAEDGSGTARFALVEVLDASTEESQSSSRHGIDPAGGELDAQLGLPAGVLKEPLRESACVQVTVLDLAGHRSAPVRACDPHHVVADPEQSPDGEFDLPDEPAWDDFAEIDDPSAESCACRAGADAGGGPILGGLILLVLGLARRRR